MNDAYSRAVFTIMDKIVEQDQKLIERFDSPQHVTEYDVRQIQEIYKAELDRASADLQGADEWENYAKYAIVAWIDSLMIANPFVGSHWRDLVLEVHYFETRGAAQDEFFKRCEEALRRGYKNAVEVFFLCFMLGFRGIYNEPSALSGFRDLPPSASEWQRRTAKIVVANLKKTRITPRPVFKFNNDPNVGFRHFIAAFLSFLFFAGILGVSIAVVWMNLQQQ